MRKKDHACFVTLPMYIWYQCVIDSPMFSQVWRVRKNPAYCRVRRNMAHFGGCMFCLISDVNMVPMYYLLCISSPYYLQVEHSLPPIVYILCLHVPNQWNYVLPARKLHISKFDLFLHKKIVKCLQLPQIRWQNCFRILATTLARRLIYQNSVQQISVGRSLVWP